MATKSEKEPLYSYKELISQSVGFEQTVLRRVLSPTKKYTIKQVESLIKDFMSKEVQN